MRKVNIAIFIATFAWLSVFGGYVHANSVVSDELKNESSHRAGIIRWSDEVLAPFLWTEMGEVTLTKEGLEQSASKKDPLRPFSLAFRLLKSYDRTGEVATGLAARRALDFMLDQYEPVERSPLGYRWFYGFPYDGIPTDWWSGMDAFLGPLALYAGWEAFGNTRYRDVAISSAKRALASPLNGGVLWRKDNKCWISEYSWSGMEPKDEFHVLNGHLYGLQALYMLASETGDQELMDAYTCARDGTFSIVSQFEMSNRTWTYYQLKPKTINPAHYLLFEMAQFRALFLLTGDLNWKRNVDVRANMFKQLYPLQIVEDRRGRHLVFSMVGAPHPYWTDTYPISVECHTGDSTFLMEQRQQYSKLPYAKRFFAKHTVNRAPDRCDVYVHPAKNDKMYVYSQHKFPLFKARTDTSTSSQVSTSYGVTPQITDPTAFIVSAVKAIDERPALTEGRIKYLFAQDIEMTDIIAFVINVDSQTQLGLIIEDESGATYTREYNNLKQGLSNLVLISPTGFNGIENSTFPIRAVTLRFYAPENKSPTRVMIPTARVLSSHADLRYFFQTNRYAYFRQQ